MGFVQFTRCNSRILWILFLKNSKTSSSHGGLFHLKADKEFVLKLLYVQVNLDIRWGLFHLKGYDGDVCSWRHSERYVYTTVTLSEKNLRCTNCMYQHSFSMVIQKPVFYVDYSGSYFRECMAIPVVPLQIHNFRTILWTSTVVYASF